MGATSSRSAFAQMKATWSRPDIMSMRNYPEQHHTCSVIVGEQLPTILVWNTKGMIDSINKKQFQRSILFSKPSLNSLCRQRYYGINLFSLLFPPWLWLISCLHPFRPSFLLGTRRRSLHHLQRFPHRSSRRQQRSVRNHQADPGSR